MEKNLKRTLILLIYIGLFLINTKAYATQIANPTNDNVRIRKEASTDSSLVVNVSSNDEVTILSKENNWYKVEVKKEGKTYSGFIREDLLVIKDETEKEVDNSGEKEQVTNNVNNEQTTNAENKNNESSNNQVTSKKSEIKEGYTAKSQKELQIKILPTINSEFIDVVKQDTEYKVIEVLNKWCYIETENKAGWIFISKLEESTSIEKEESNDSNKEVTENTETSDNAQEIQNEVDSSKQESEDKKEDNNQENDTEKVKDNTSKEVKNETKYVTVDTLNVREKASSNSNVIEQLDLNEKVTVLEVVDETWAKVVKNGKTGYVSVKFLSDKKTEITSRSGDTSRENQEVESNQIDSSSVSGSSVVEFAKQYLGYKYVSGGASPSTGFDCSGFTTYVFKHFGISLSRTSGVQASNGTKVEKSNLEPGDILIFNDSANSKVGHVGIYIGGNQFIHAANAKKGVIITSLSDSYYSARYVGARRVL